MSRNMKVNEAEKEPHEAQPQSVKKRKLNRTEKVR